VSVSLVLRHSLPRFIQRNVAQTLTADVYDADSAQQTATAGTLTLYQGSTVILDAVSVTTLGPPATYDLLAAATDGLSLADDWLELWALTIGGVVHTFRRQAFLVRHVLHAVISDADLLARYDELTSLLDADTPDFSEKRTAAFDIIQRKLIMMGRRPELVLNAWALAELHIHKSLELIFGDFASNVSDGRYANRELHHREQYEATLDGLVLRYDSDAAGTLSGDDETGAIGAVWLSRPHRSY
jgi:hypothetical protein